MNVLLFVTTMIMVLSMLTYTKLETYRNFSLLQAEFTRFMEETERGYINKTAVWWYENSPATRRNANSSANSNPKTAARSRLSFLFFIDKAKQAQYAPVYPKIVLLAKKLMLYLYQNQPFFQEILQQRPDCIDALLASLMNAANNLPQEEKIKKASELANLNLDDPLLNSFFYYVLKGTAFPENTQTTTSKVFTTQPQLIIKESSGEVDDDGGDPNKKQYYDSPEGYYSLLDYINVDDAVKIRVFLAPKALLMAIFDTESVVDSIIAMRNDLYNKVINDSVSAADAGAQFKTATAPKSDPNFDDTILDYTITKTNPKNYE
jgi:hypothetical protein